MTQKAIHFGLAALLAVAVAAPAQASAGRKARAINANLYEVTGRNSGDGTGIWCEAANFARRTLKASWQTPIYVASPMGNSQFTGRKGAVQFTLNPKAVGVTPGTNTPSINKFVVGNTMTVQEANYQCTVRNVSGF